VERTFDMDMARYMLYSLYHFLRDRNRISGHHTYYYLGQLSSVRLGLEGKQMEKLMGLSNLFSTRLKKRGDVSSRR